MVKRKMVLLIGLFVTVACSGNDVAAPTEAVAEVEQAATAVVETAGASESAPTETVLPEAAPAETTPSEPVASPTPLPAVAGEAAGAEADAIIVCDGRPTPANPEGPFYTPNTPERTSLIEEGMEGVPITISGRVLSTACEPVARAMVDFWQTDAAGEYDNVGYRLRGHQFTDEEGKYTLETIIPGQYPGRTAHIHLKIFSPDGTEALISQLYIPGLSEGVPDGFFDQRLLVRLVAAEGGEQQGFFDFIVR